MVFASNSSRHASGVLRAAWPSWGSSRRRQEMLAALDLAGEEVRRQMGAVRVLPIGTEELVEILRASGHEIVADEDWPTAQAVVVGIDPHFSYDRLRAASRAVAAGASFFAVNMDRNFPVGPGMFDPGCGIAGRGDRRRPAARGRSASASRSRRCSTRRSNGSAASPARRRWSATASASDIEGGRAAGMFTVWLEPRAPRAAAGMRRPSRPRTSTSCTGSGAGRRLDAD